VEIADARAHGTYCMAGRGKAANDPDGCIKMINRACDDSD
jgi:hypothetical protein